FQSRRRPTRRRDRLESWIFALRLSRGRLFRTAPTVPASALRATGSFGDGAKPQHPADYRAQNHARCSTLRPHFAGRAKTGTGGRVLFVHVATGHGRASDRHRLSTERIGRRGSVNLPARRLAVGIAFVCEQRQSGRENEESGRDGSTYGVPLS